jgi:hypothetical protein
LKAPPCCSPLFGWIGQRATWARGRSSSVDSGTVSRNAFKFTTKLEPQKLSHSHTTVNPRMSSEPVPVSDVAVKPKAIEAAAKAASTETTTTNVPPTAPESSPAPDAPKSPITDSVPHESVTTATPEKASATGISTPEKKTVDFVEVKGAMENIINELPSIIKDTAHSEIWGVELVPDINNVPTTVVLEKFLRANNRNVAEAIVQLKKALKWRKEMNPIELLANVEFDESRFGNLGYVTVYPQPDGKVKEIVTWNIYGAVKDKKATFGNVEE